MREDPAPANVESVFRGRAGRAWKGRREDLIADGLTRESLLSPLTSIPNGLLQLPVSRDEEHVLKGTVILVSDRSGYAGRAGTAREAGATRNASAPTVVAARRT